MNARRRAVKELISAGYVKKRSGANHDIFYHEKLRSAIPLKRHDFDEDDLRYIQKEIRQNKDRGGQA